VRELGLTSRELSEMQILYELEPWGSRPADERAALIAWAVLAPHVKPRPKIRDIVRLMDRGLEPERFGDEDQAQLERFFRGGES
jgi:hypothetical protein